MSPAAPGADIESGSRSRAPRPILAPDSPLLDPRSEQEIRELLFEVVSKMTFGLEQELWPLRANGFVANVKQHFPSLYRPAKNPSSRPDLGPVGELSSGQVEYQSRIQNDISMRGVRNAIDEMLVNIVRKQQAAKSPWVISAVPYVVKKLDMVKDQRYREYQRRFPDSVGPAMHVASLQVNISTAHMVDGEDRRNKIRHLLGILLTSMTGDSTARRVALSAASPNMWSGIKRRLRYRYDGEATGSHEANLVPTGRMSSRPVTFRNTRSSEVPPPTASIEEYEQQLAAAMDALGLRNIPKNHGFRHVLTRWREWGGVESRETDPPPTREEVALLVLDSIADLLIHTNQLSNGMLPAQGSRQARRWALEKAEESGMSGSLRDPVTRRSSPAFDLLNDHFDSAKELLEAFEQRDFASIVGLATRTDVVTDPEFVSEMYVEAKRTIALLEKVGVPARRQELALGWFRGRPEADPKGIFYGNERALTRDEAMFLQSFLMAETQMGLTDVREVVHERAFELFEITKNGGLVQEFEKMASKQCSVEPLHASMSV